MKLGGVANHPGNWQILKTAFKGLFSDSLIYVFMYLCIYLFILMKTKHAHHFLTGHFSTKKPQQKVTWQAKLSSLPSQLPAEALAGRHLCTGSWKRNPKANWLAYTTGWCLVGEAGGSSSHLRNFWS